MRILDAKIEPLRDKIIIMFDEVFKQLIKSKSALETLDKELAKEIIAHEKDIDFMETDIAEHCENFLAVYTPVADDLRYIMAINNINPSLERIADIIEKIAKYVKKYNESLPVDLQKEFGIDQLYEIIINMYELIRVGFVNNTINDIGILFDEDKKINKLNKQAKVTVLDLIKEYPQCSAQCINLLLIVSKMERLGDLIKNIAEEITFYIDAKSIKHK